MNINTDFIKYDFLNNEKLKKAYLTLKNDTKMSCNLFRIYGTMQDNRFYACIGKFERILRNEISTDYIFLNIFNKECSSIVTVSEVDIQQLSKTNLFLDDIINLIKFNYNDNFYKAVEFNLADFFN